MLYEYYIDKLHELEETSRMKSTEKIRILMELRRSNAAGKHKNNKDKRKADKLRKEIRDQSND